jgi:hypothetical protein
MTGWVYDESFGLGHFSAGGTLVLDPISINFHILRPLNSYGIIVFLSNTSILFFFVGKTL